MTGYSGNKNYKVNTHLVHRGCHMTWGKTGLRQVYLSQK